MALHIRLEIEIQQKEAFDLVLALCNWRKTFPFLVMDNKNTVEPSLCTKSHDEAEQFLRSILLFESRI